MARYYFSSAEEETAWKLKPSAQDHMAIMGGPRVTHSQAVGSRAPALRPCLSMRAKPPLIALASSETFHLFGPSPERNVSKNRRLIINSKCVTD